MTSAPDRCSVVEVTPLLFLPPDDKGVGGGGVGQDGGTPFGPAVTSTGYDAMLTPGKLLSSAATLMK